MKSNRMSRFRLEQTLQTKENELYSQVLSRVLDSNVYINGYKNRVLGLLRSRRIDLLLDFADSLGRTEYSSPAEHYAANQLAA
jgi:hypothetical protein